MHLCQINSESFKKNHNKIKITESVKANCAKMNDGHSKLTVNNN